MYHHMKKGSPNYIFYLVDVSLVGVRIEWQYASNMNYNCHFDGTIACALLTVCLARAGLVPEWLTGQTWNLLAFGRTGSNPVQSERLVHVFQDSGSWDALTTSGVRRLRVVNSGYDSQVSTLYSSILISPKVWTIQICSIMVPYFYTVSLFDTVHT